MSATIVLPEKCISRIDDCRAQVTSALDAVEAMTEGKQQHLLLGRLTHADVAAVLAVRIARAVFSLDTQAQIPRLHALTARLSEQPAFQVAEP